MTDEDTEEPQQLGPGEEVLTLEVAVVWREERVSCPHPDVLRAFLAAGLDDEASQFVAFHLQESECPYCNATVEEIQAEAADATAPKLEDLRKKLLRSTVAALQSRRGRP